MLSFETILGLRCYLEAQPTATIASLASPTIGFVPTMGALHQGHRSLIDRARQENDLVIVSIFVNPLQFAPGEDLDKYPRQLAADRRLCTEAGVDVIFNPTSESLNLGDELTQVVPPASLTSGLCGRSRPGHFTGVATIVTKLLQIIRPTNSYFGQKDAQQVAIIRKLAQDLYLSGRIVTCPIVRAASGLALSSRNQYLSVEQQAQAANIYRNLKLAQDLWSMGDQLSNDLLNAIRSNLQEHPEIELEYLELVDPETLALLDAIETSGLLAIAAKVGNTRLIDNLLLTKQSPIIAIDGPAGAGKSTVTKLVAKTLGLQFLDTGAMYRAVTWLVLQAQLPLDSAAEIAELVAKSKIELQGDRVLINGQDISTEIRSLEVTGKVSAIAALGAVRTALVQQQQSIGRNGGIVAEGRDMCTYVFPDAGVKIFLTATVGERARRRLADLHASGDIDISLAELEASIAERDRLDSTRAIAPLKKAATATEIVTDGMSIEQVVAEIVNLYRTN
jgi:pantoate ligase / CMP/dCMP kinase